MPDVIPAEFQGRKVTRRGVHLLPGSYQAGWMANPGRRAMFLQMLLDMHMSWVLILTAGDSCLEVFDGRTVVEWFLDIGIIPVIRDSPPEPARLPSPYSNQENVRRIVEVYAGYGLTPIIQLWNEPGNAREWRKKVPRDWWQVFVSRFNPAASKVIELGAFVLFPDGPNYDFEEQHPFRDVPQELWDSGMMGYGVHNYGKGRPLDYPYDPVSQLGISLTEEAWSEQLDDYAGDPAWRQPSLEFINRQREEWAQPGLTAVEDDTCWRAYEKIDHYARDVLGHPVLMATTEGGWVPRDKAGSDPIDDRWPYTTPKMVAKKTLAAYETEELAIICPWLLACAAMGGGGWEDDSWFGGSYMDKYGLAKPVVQALMENPPGGEPRCRWTAVREGLERMVGVVAPP